MTTDSRFDATAERNVIIYNECAYAKICEIFYTTYCRFYVLQSPLIYTMYKFKIKYTWPKGPYFIHPEADSCAGCSLLDSSLACDKK